MRKLVVFAIIACSACGGSPTSPDLDAGRVSPSGAFLVQPGDYGPPTDEHLRLADARWQELTGCLGLAFTPRHFPIILRKNLGGPLIAYFLSGSGQPIGGIYHPLSSIEVLGDPLAVQAWKHELMHYLLDAITGNPDAAHTRGGRIEYIPGYSQGADWLRCTVS